MTSNMRAHATLPRLYVDASLRADAEIELPSDQAHYLGKVMRLKVGASIRVFNGNDGEWLAEISELGKREATIKSKDRLRAAEPVPDIWVLFAPVKKARNAFIAEKATELGASLIQPIKTRRTTAPKLRMDRLQAQIIEAAEQTERMDIPKTVDPVKLPDMLSTWEESRTLIFADEAGDAVTAISALAEIKAPAAILIGPEGGFDPQERELLRSQSYVVPISLGPRILRADTAVAATLALWQAVSGDWA